MAIEILNEVTRLKHFSAKPISVKIVKIEQLFEENGIQKDLPQIWKVSEWDYAYCYNRLYLEKLYSEKLYLESCSPSKKIFPR